MSTYQTYRNVYAPHRVYLYGPKSKGIIVLKRPNCEDCETAPEDGVKMGCWPSRLISGTGANRFHGRGSR